MNLALRESAPSLQEILMDMENTGHPEKIDTESAQRTLGPADVLFCIFSLYHVLYRIPCRLLRIVVSCSTRNATLRARTAYGNRRNVRELSSTADCAASINKPVLEI